jgi:hypothetical protein
VQSEDGACERRPSRSRKPSEKMKDLIEAPPASGKRGARSGKIDLLDGQHADIMAMQDAIPDSAFDSAALGSDTCADAAEFREDTIPVQGMSPTDLGWYSVYLVYWYKSTKTDVATATAVAQTCISRHSRRISRPTLRRSCWTGNVTLMAARL